MARLRGPVTMRDAHARLIEQGVTAGVREIVAAGLMAPGQFTTGWT